MSRRRWICLWSDVERTTAEASEQIFRSAERGYALGFCGGLAEALGVVAAVCPSCDQNCRWHPARKKLTSRAVRCAIFAGDMCAAARRRAATRPITMTGNHAGQ